MSRKRKQSSQATSGGAPKTRHLPAGALWPWIGSTALIFVALVALDQFFLHPGVLTTFHEREPLSPLYAFVIPACRSTAFIFVFLTVGSAFIVPRLLRLRGPSRFAAALSILSVALPLALFLVRDELSQLGSQFLIYQGEEYFEDAAGITNLAEFIRHYSEIAPQLSLHGRVHPPGSATLLYLVRQAISPTPFAAGVTVLVVFAAGIVAAWRAFAVVIDERGARVAALMLLAAPSLLDFACTSMDAVFFATACLVLYGTFLSLSDRGTWWQAVLAGIAIYLAAFCSFSAVPLGLFIATYSLVLWWSDRRSLRIPRQLSIVFLAFLAVYVSVQLAIGFDLWESFEVAKSLHYQIMGQVMGRTVASAYFVTSIGNLSALLVGTGLAIVPLFFCAASAVMRAGTNRTLVLATIATVGMICAGGLYTMETERILMFVMPWLAVSAVATTTLSDSAVVLLLGAGWIQALGMEILLFTLW